MDIKQTQFEITTNRNKKRLKKTFSCYKAPMSSTIALANINTKHKGETKLIHTFVESFSIFMIKYL